MRTITLAFILAISAACTAQQGPFFVSSVQALSDTCKFSTGSGATPVQLAAIDTTIDVRADPALSIAVEVSGADDFSTSTSQPPVQVGGRLLAPAGKEHGIVQKVVLRYASKPAIPGINANTVDSYPLGGVLSGKTMMPIELFGPLLRSKLKDLSPSNEDTYALKVSFEVHGVLDQSQTPWHTPAYSMDLTLVNSDVTCAPPADNRFIRFPNATAPCYSAGVFRRVNPTDCCGLAPGTVDGRPGCDRSL